MEAVINNLDYDALVPIWKNTFPNLSIDEYIDTLEYTDRDEILDDVRSLIIEELRRLERLRQKDNEDHIQALMEMEPLPLITHESHRRRKGKKFIDDIRKEYERRQQRMSELKQTYYDLHPEDEFIDSNDESFHEWLRNKDAPSNDETIREFMDSIQLGSVIDFQKLNRNDRTRVFEQMKARFEEVFGELSITNKYIIHYRINGQWKSRTLTSDMWRQLMETLDRKEFIYAKESFETSLMQFSNETEEGLFKLIHFDAIRIEPVIDAGNQRKDNRSSFFKYFNTSDIDLSRYQIFPSITKMTKKGKPVQIKELNDSCFVYALMIYGVNNEILNKIRLRINTRKLGANKMDSICDEFKIHAVVNDLEYTNKNSKFRVNGKNYFGCPESQAQYVISSELMVRITLDVLNHKLNMS